MAIEIKNMQLSSKILNTSKSNDSLGQSKEKETVESNCSNPTTRHDKLIQQNMKNIAQLFEARRER